MEPGRVGRTAHFGACAIVVGQGIRLAHKKFLGRRHLYGWGWGEESRDSKKPIPFVVLCVVSSGGV